MRSVSIIIVLFLSCTSYSQDTEQFDKGVEFFNAENYSKALNAFKKFQKKNDGITLEFFIASCYFKLEEFSVAKNHFIEIISTYKGDEEVGWSMVNLGSCYRKLNKIDSAIYYYKSSIEIYPEANGYFNLAQLYYSLDDFAEAKEQYNLAIDYDSTNAFFYSKRQEINFILNDYKSALEDMLTARKYDTIFYQAGNEAFCHSMMNNYSKADSVFKLIYDDKDALFLNNYGLNKHKLGNSNEGMDLILKSLKISPTNSYAYRNLAIINLDRNNTDSACSNLSKAKELNFYTYYGNEVNELLTKFCE